MRVKSGTTTLSAINGCNQVQVGTGVFRPPWASNMTIRGAFYLEGEQGLLIEVISVALQLREGHSRVSAKPGCV